jgi:hypothetical protein
VYRSIAIRKQVKVVLHTEISIRFFVCASHMTEKWYFVGQMQIKPVNQTGTALTLNPTDGTFFLSRRPSIFEVFVLRSSDPELNSSFSELLQIRLVVDGRFLGVSFETGQAIAAPLDSDGAVDDVASLIFHKCKFDHIGSSFRWRHHEGDRWLRHSNSKVYVCEQAKSFLLRL